MPPLFPQMTKEVHNTEHWRLFCAVPLPQAVKDQIRDHINRLCQSIPQVQASWVHPDNVHLTVKFIGETPKARSDDLVKAASRAAEKSRAFQIRIEQAGAFPKHGPPRVLWIGIHDFSGNLGELQARLENQCANEGFPKEPRAFHPHLTIARLRKPHGARTLAQVHQTQRFEAIDVEVAELLVIRSELGREAAKYTVLSRHPLAATGQG